jgi:LuxR family maltose regulon positive regulatory protein
LSSRLPGLAPSTATDADTERYQVFAAVVGLLVMVSRAQPVVLVLDDFHLIQSQSIQAAVGYLVDHLPDGLHLVIAGRSDPPLSLARLRARGELNELRGPDLRFNTQETAGFLNQVMGLALTAAEVEALEARTEGWIAGLQLAALSMHDRKDVDRFIKVFTGSHRYILDYLVEEVLRRQPEDVQDFLLKTSILERMCAELCDTVLENRESRMEGSNDSPFSTRASRTSQPMLVYLEQTNLFIQPLDDERTWYRYHTLFADLLRYRLEQTLPDQVEGLHRRAAEWYQQNGLPVESVAHWTAARDWGRAALQVDAAGQDLLNQGRGRSFTGWLDRLPAAVFEAHPKLHMLYTWGLMQTSQFGEIEPHLQEAERILQSRPPEPAPAEDWPEARILRGEIAGTRAILASLGGDMTRVIQLSEKALVDLPESNGLRCTLLFSLGIAQLLAGETRRAERAFDESARIAQQTGQLSVGVAVLANHGDVWMILGNLELAEKAYTQAISLTAGTDQGVLSVVSMGHAGLAGVQREKGNFSLAREHILKALELDEQWGNRDIHAINLARLAQILFSCGDPAGGWLHGAHPGLAAAPRSGPAGAGRRLHPAQGLSAPAPDRTRRLRCQRRVSHGPLRHHRAPLVR